MAGHPTIGSTFALVTEGVIKPGQPGFVFGLGRRPNAGVSRMERHRPPLRVDDAEESGVRP